MVTSINGTDSEILDYYLGRWFNQGVVEDHLVECVGVKFLD